MKSTVLVCFVLYALEVGAFPSVATKTLTVEELNHMIQVTMAQTLKDLLTTTTTLAPVPISTEETASVAPPWQLSAAQNLTNSIEELVKSLKDLTSLSTTPAPALAYDERFKSIEQDLKTHFESITKLTTAVEHLTVTAAKNLCGSESGYEYWPVTKSCYKLHNESLGWSAADKACLAEGAYLAVINSHNEQQHLNDIGRGISNIYVGVYKDNAEQWTTVTGETVERAAGYHHIWGTNEPYSGATWLFASLYVNGILISRTESNTFPFVCEKASSTAQIVL